MRPGLYALAALSALVLGCSPPAAVEDPGPVSAVMPADASHPKELLGVWNMKNGSSLELGDGGQAVVHTVLGEGAPGVKLEPRKEAASWGVKGKELFLTINGFTNAYDFKVAGSKLTMGKGRIQFEYKR